MSNEKTVQLLRSNYEHVLERVRSAAIRSDRDPEQVKLIGVSKYVDASTTRCLVEAGCRILGESRPQLLWEKGEKLPDLDVEWHMIGHLQRNKVRKTLMFARQIHSCDSLRLFDAINSIGAETNRRVKCFLEVNISGEEAKHGFRVDELESALEAISKLPHVLLNGLMGMGSWGRDPQANREEFKRLRELRIQFANYDADNITLDELSMGMSGDFEIAIEEGSTMVRIGSSLFEGVL